MADSDQNPDACSISKKYNADAAATIANDAQIQNQSQLRTHFARVARLPTLFFAQATTAS
jgi:hypothetical protein